MQQMFRLMLAAIVAAAVTHFAGVAMAQNAVKQIKLTDKQSRGVHLRAEGHVGGRREDAKQRRQA